MIVIRKKIGFVLRLTVEIWKERDSPEFMCPVESGRFR